ncbi:MAG TPA: FkbM family methyltransferase [Chryseolinea sp.]|nr:FkbM family methyltransferase [Chryseolinea sp.]
MNSLKKNLAQIYFEILKEPLNAGRRLRFLINFFRWKLLYKYFNRRWTIQLENGFRSFVYPFPDHDAGEVNIWTRNVDFYELQFVRSHLHPGDFVCDVGCNIGNRTLALADMINGGILFDAGSHAIERAKENFAFNNLDSKFIFIHKAVGANPGTIYFSDLGGASTLNKIVNNVHPGSNRIAVELTTLNEEVRKLSLKPAFIKIDTEGYDLEVLKGATELIEGGYLRLIQFERLQNTTVESFEEFFNSLDWRVFALQEGKPTQNSDDVYKSQNLFAAPKEYFLRSIISNENHP